MFFTYFKVHFNEQNTKLQCCGRTVINMVNILGGFERKLKIFKCGLNSYSCKYFPLMKQYLESMELFKNSLSGKNGAMQQF
jgi:hypothetical protein